MSQLSRRVRSPFGGALFCCAIALPAPGWAEQVAELKAAPVPGWPELKVEVHYVARIVMRGRCFPVPPGTPIPQTTTDSCARPDFWRGVCDVFIDQERAGRSRLLAHETRRCQGHDPVGGDQFARALRAWREHGENRYADMLDFQSMMFVLEPLKEECAGEGRCIELR